MSGSPKPNLRTRALEMVQSDQEVEALTLLADEGFVVHLKRHGVPLHDLESSYVCQIWALPQSGWLLTMEGKGDTLWAALQEALAA